MIGEAELRRLAARWGVDPMVVDLDYSLGWFIAALYGANEGAERIYFKERVICPPETWGLLHPYSDVEMLGVPAITCYALVEILAEKLRAIGGQRRFAISRDLYDIHHLLQAGVSVAEVAPSLSAKFAARGVNLAALEISQFAARRADFAADWERRLSYLVRAAPQVTFAAAWETALEVLQQIKEYHIP